MTFLSAHEMFRMPICKPLLLKKHYVVSGPEFGLENVGKHAIIVRAFYGGKSFGANYWRHVRSTMEEMGF